MRKLTGAAIFVVGVMVGILFESRSSSSSQFFVPPPRIEVNRPVHQGDGEFAFFYSENTFDKQFEDIDPNDHDELLHWAWVVCLRGTVLSLSKYLGTEPTEGAVAASIANYLPESIRSKATKSCVTTLKSKSGGEP